MCVAVVKETLLFTLQAKDLNASMTYIYKKIMLHINYEHTSVMILQSIL